MYKRLCVLMLALLLTAMDCAFADARIDRMVRVLRSLDIQVSDKMAAEYENEINEYYAGLPEGVGGGWDYYTYESFLNYLGMGNYDAQADRYIPVTDDVYAFDTEAYDIVHAYEDLLMAIDRMAGSEVQLENISIEWSPRLFQTGRGKMPVHYTLNGDEYTYQADFQTDWVDCEIIDDLNRNLQAHGVEKKVWNMYDGGQGLILFFNTAQWAKYFEAATGCELESSTGATLGLGGLFDLLF